MDLPDDPSLIESLLARLRGSEDPELEFKLAKGGLPKSLWETVSAFANTNGGWIILGIDDSQRPAKVVGVPNASKRLDDFFSALRSPEKMSFAPCGSGDALLDTIADREIIMIRVPAVPRRNRPVYTGNNPYRGTWVRRNTGDYRATKQEVDRMMREAHGEPNDLTVALSFGWDDLDLEALSRYRRMHQTQNPTSPLNSLDDLAFLNKIGGFGKDRESGASGITVAGLLMFGNPLALQEWRGRHLIDYQLVSRTADSNQRWDDRIAWDGNLFGAFETLYPRLTAGLPSAFELQGPTRADQGHVHVALREALVNLLVHADYTEKDPSLIIQSPDGYFFRNPGCSLVSEADLFTEYRSELRNPQLVRMFRYIGWAEEAGTGIVNIVRTWRSLGLFLPRIDVGTERYEFSLFLHHVHLFSDDDRAWLVSLGEGWSEPEQIALLYAKHETYVSNERLRSMVGLHPTDATKLLGSLRDRGYLEMNGTGRGASYVLGPLAQRTETMVAEFGDGTVNSEDKESSSEGNTVSSEDKESNSEGNTVSSENVREKLERLAEPARRQRRLPPNQRNDIIVALCAVAPLSLDEIARLMERKESSLRDVIRGLISTGDIGYLYPKQPNHPKQKYVTLAVDE